jgi:hypothetical protein
MGQEMKIWLLEDDELKELDKIIEDKPFFLEDLVTTGYITRSPDYEISDECYAALVSREYRIVNSDIRVWSAAWMKETLAKHMILWELKKEIEI